MLVTNAIFISPQTLQKQTKIEKAELEKNLLGDFCPHGTTQKFWHTSHLCSVPRTLSSPRSSIWQGLCAKEYLELEYQSDLSNEDPCPEWDKQENNHQQVSFNRHQLSETRGTPFSTADRWLGTDNVESLILISLLMKKANGKQNHMTLFYVGQCSDASSLRHTLT